MMTVSTTIGERAAAFAGGLRALCQKRMRVMAGAGKAERQMQVIETLALGNRRQLCLVQVGRQQFLVGCDATGVTAITAVAEPGGSV